jgi:hypothetical protein
MDFETKEKGSLVIQFAVDDKGNVNFFTGEHEMAKKNIFLGLFAAAILWGSVAEATLDRILPSSSHYQGFVYYDEIVEGPFGNDVTLRGRIDFAVYDRGNLQNSEEAAFVDNYVSLAGVSEDDQFIYAYQIFNDYDGFSEGEIGYFEVLGLQDDETTFSINPSLMNNTTALDDGLGGVEPEPVDSVEAGIWEWLSNLVDAGTHSQFLLYSSVNDWVKGTYRMDMAQESDFPVTPEPATLAMLGAGGAMLLRRRRKY